MRGFVIPGKGGSKPRAIVTSDNKKLKPYRQELTETAMTKVEHRPWAEKHVPVRLELMFYLQKPPSAPKKRHHPVVKPDLSKLIRASEDAMTGVLYADDAQIVSLIADKLYGDFEGVQVTARIMSQAAVGPPHETLLPGLGI